MGVMILPAIALERLIIGIYWGNVNHHVRQFDAIRMAHDLSQTYFFLRTIREDDVTTIYRHAQTTNSPAWIRCTQELKAQSPEVLRVLRDVKDLSDDKKANMGRYIPKKKAVVAAVPGNRIEPKVFSHDYKEAKGRNLPEVDGKEPKALPYGLLW